MKKISYLLMLLIVGCEINNVIPEDVIRQQPKISIEEAVVMELDENTNLNFTVSLSWDYTEEVKVDYQSVEETALEGDDYLPASGTLTFQPGEIEKTISVEVIGENIFETDEKLKIELSNPVNSSLLILEANGTIQNDDDANELVIPETGYTTPETYPGMSLIWNDEFDGDAINTEEWSYDLGTGSGGWGNNELQFYTEKNAFLTSGNLIIEAKRESQGGNNFTSSRLKTQNKKNFRFGRVDIRAVLPEGQGIWPALWMLGAKFNAVGWPRCGEIDIMELVGNQPDRVHGTVHYGTSVAARQSKGGSTRLPDLTKFSGEFHVFSLVWEEDKIEWLVDDVVFYEFSKSDAGGFPYPFNDSFFFIFNVAVGGEWPGSPDDTTLFPQRMIVDYVRVFQ